MKNTLSKCKLCENANLISKVQEKYIQFDCPSCNSTNFDFKIEYDYGSDEKYADERYLDNYETRWAHELVISNRLLSEGEKVMEAGCYNGFYVRMLLDNGFDAYGFDIIKDALAYGQKNLGLDNRLYDKIPEFKFDTLIMIDVLEHIENPKEFLKSVIDKNSISKVIVSCPNRQRFFYDKADWPPHHFWRYSEDSFDTIFNQLGFKKSSIAFEMSILLFLRNFIGRILYGWRKKWFEGDKVFSVSENSRKMYVRIDKILSYPFKLMGIKYASILVVYVK